jgi:hypothetical protein
MALLKEKIELGIEEAEFNAQRALSTFPPFLKWALIALIIGLVPGYYIAKTLSQKYWEGKLNIYQIKATSSFSNPQELKIEPALVLTYSDGGLGAVALVSNSNNELTAQNVSYSWVYYGQTGERITPLNSQATKGSFYILPKSKKYIMVPKIQTSETITRAELLLDLPVKWQKRLEMPPVLLQVTPANTNQQNSPLAFSVESSVLNNSPYLVKEINLSFLIYGQNGQIVAVSQRTENDIKPFEKRAFKQLWPGLFVTPSKVEILADTNTLKPGNLVVLESENNSSDLSQPKNQNNFGF